LRDRFWERFHELADAGRSIVVTTQYVGEAGECDLVGLLSDGELLLLDTPANLRRAAFAGEVVDVKLERPISDDELRSLEQFDFVIGSVERVAAGQIRLVVDDADAALDDIRSAFDSMGVHTDDIAEHVVDYDEAFVQIVERHRSGGVVDDGDSGVDVDADAITDGTDGAPAGDTTDQSEVDRVGAP
jgi:ABC-2 type transport system ATP-binding protein